MGLVWLASRLRRVCVAWNIPLAIIVATDYLCNGASKRNRTCSDIRRHSNGSLITTIAIG